MWVVYLFNKAQKSWINTGVEKNLSFANEFYTTILARTKTRFEYCFYLCSFVLKIQRKKYLKCLKLENGSSDLASKSYLWNIFFTLFSILFSKNLFFLNMSPVPDFALLFCSLKYLKKNCSDVFWEFYF